MGLDIYVGSLTRYYAGDWKTIIQQLAEKGALGDSTMHVVRPEQPDDAITDPEQIHELVTLWRQRLTEALGEHISMPLSWDERADAPYFTDKPAWDCYGHLLLWAAYDEHPEMERPTEGVEEWPQDPAYVASRADGYQTLFPQLLGGVEMWLPHDFPFTFSTMAPNGTDCSFGSSPALLRELEELNVRTWEADEDEIQRWRRQGADRGAPLEQGARFAYSIMRNLTRKSVENDLPIKLDY
jgi:hypothetical protein